MDWHNYEKYGNRVRHENDFRDLKNTFRKWTILMAGHFGAETNGKH